MSLLSQHINASVAAIGTLTQLEDEYERACETMARALETGKKILACGNGGSAADSGHFTTELLCRFVTDRPALAAISLTQDGGFLTATGNDYGFEQIFSRQIEGLGQTGDVLVGFSTSGESRNIQAAFLAAKNKGLRTIALLGRGGGICRGLAEIELIVPVDETARIQEAHKVLIHAFCAGIERRLFGK
ncbi:MAG: D-sedoheptulose-7-phosphate isomerase [Verrucomicrobiales bacterium]